MNDLALTHPPRFAAAAPGSSSPVPEWIAFSRRRLVDCLPDEFRSPGSGEISGDVLLPCAELFARPVPQLRVSRLAALLPGIIREGNAASDQIVFLPPGELALGYYPTPRPAPETAKEIPEALPLSPSWKRVPKPVLAPSALETVSTAVPSLQPDFSTRLLGRSEALQQMIQTSDPLTTQRVVDWFASFRGVLAVSLTNSAGGDASGGQFPEKAGGDVLARQAASLMNQARTLVTKDHLGEPSVVSVRADRGVLTILRAERLTLAVIHDASPAFNDEAAKRMLEGALELDRLLAVDAKR